MLRKRAKEKVRVREESQRVVAIVRVMTGMHKVFPPGKDEEEDPIAPKKLKKGEGKWMLRKDLLGFDFDGEAKTMALSKEKRVALIAKSPFRGVQFHD